MPERLEIQVQPGIHAPGDDVRGTVLVREGGRCRSLSVALRCYERSPGYREAVRTELPSELHAGDLESGQRLAFDLSLPADASPDIDGRHGGVSWAVDARWERPGFDYLARARVEVGVRR
jgi:hypothetical protein